MINTTITLQTLVDNGWHTVVELVFLADWAHKNDKGEIEFILLHNWPFATFVITDETYTSEKGLFDKLNANK